MTKNTATQARNDGKIKEKANDALFQPLIPNDETIAAMKEARAGELKSFETVKDFINELHRQAVRGNNPS